LFFFSEKVIRNIRDPKTISICSNDAGPG